MAAPKGERERLEIPLVAPAGAILPASIKVNKHGCAPRRFPKGDRRLRLFSLPFGRLRRGEISCLQKRAAMSERPAVRSRPFGATICKWSNTPLGGAPAGAQSYWQGRFAACAFVGGFLGIGRTRNCWGVAPNPTRELRPLTPQGTLSLDPFSASRLERTSLTLPLPAFFLPLPLVYAPKPSTASPTAQSQQSSRPATNTTRRESRKSATA